MKCLEDANKHKVIETELLRLLEGVKYYWGLLLIDRDIGDSTSLVTYDGIYRTKAGFYGLHSAKSD